MKTITVRISDRAWESLLYHALGVKGATAEILEADIVRLLEDKLANQARACKELDHLISDWMPDSEAKP